jgi:hypothetical protein
MHDEQLLPESEDAEALFPLFDTDRGLIEALARSVRKLIHREDATAEQIHHLAVLLFGLKRLPLTTPGVDVTLTLSYRTESSMNYQSIDLDGSSFALSFGGSVYEPNIGTDGYGDDVLMVEDGGFRDVKRRQIVDWLADFKRRLADAEIKMELDESCEVDWSEEPDDSAWERATKRYNADDELEED